MATRKEKPAARKKTKRAASGFEDRICNLIPSKDVQNDWTPSDGVAAGALAAAPSIPASKDLRQSW